MFVKENYCGFGEVNIGGGSIEGVLEAGKPIYFSVLMNSYLSTTAYLQYMLVAI